MKKVETSEFVQAMSLHVSSVCVITTQHDGQRYGLTATAVSSVCADPPRLLVCVNKSGISHEKMAASGIFCVNVIAEDQEKIGKAFAGMLGKEFDKFSVGDWKSLATGSPALVGATSVFDCTVVSTIDQFSHSIFIGEVVATATHPTKDVLLYGARKFRNLRKTISPQFDGDVETLHF